MKSKEGQEKQHQDRKKKNDRQRSVPKNRGLRNTEWVRLITYQALCWAPSHAFNTKKLKKSIAWNLSNLLKVPQLVGGRTKIYILEG